MTIPHIGHLHAFHIGTAAIGVVFLVCMYQARIFLKECLSEANEKGAIAGSHKRLIAFMFATTICICEIYHTFKKGELDFQHLLAFLATAMLYSSVATLAQIIALWKGGTSSVTVEQKTTETVQSS